MITKVTLQVPGVFLIMRGGIEIEVDAWGTTTVAHWPYTGRRKSLANFYQPVKIEAESYFSEESV